MVLLFFTGLILAVLLAVRWRSILLLIPLLLNPVSLGFGFGLPEWFHEKPQFYWVGLPNDEEYYNLDPATRCYYETCGCKRYGNEWLTLSPRHAALSFMVNVFGPPKHTYHGPYPSKAEAIQLTETSSETPREMFSKGKVMVNGKELAIGTNKVQNLLSDLGMTLDEELFEIDGSKISRKVAAAVFQEHCLILRISFKDPDDPEKPSESIVLFDIDKVQPFARYVLSGGDYVMPRPLSY